jgi:hypothetical protein
MVDLLTRSAYRSRRAVSRAAEAAVLAAWLDADGRDEDRFVERAITTERSARARTVAGVDAHMTTLLAANRLPASPVGLDPDDYARPVDLETRWRRPFVHMRTKLSQGMAFPAAFAVGTAYARDAIVTDLQLAYRGAARDRMQSDNRIVGWSRVLGDGGASGKNCGLCVVASTQRYHAGDLMPIHDHCTCSAVPILGTQDPGQVLRADDLDSVFERLEEFDGSYSNRADLGRVRISASELPRPTVHMHGELGPVLYDSSWQFTGPAAVAA